MPVQNDKVPVMHRRSDGDHEIAVIDPNSAVGTKITGNDGNLYQLTSREEDKFGIYFWAKRVDQAAS